MVILSLRYMKERPENNYIDHTSFNFGTFTGYNDNLIVNHKNGNKLANLEYVTYQQNNVHAI